MPPTSTMPTSGLGSTAETNRLLGGQYFNPQTGAQIQPFVPVNPNKTIGTDAIGTQPYNLPPTDTSPTFGSLTMSNNSVASQIKTDSTYEPTETNTEKTALKSYLGGLLGGGSEQAGKEDQIKKDAQLQEKEDRALSIYNELDVLDKQFRDDAKNIRESGISRDAANAIINSAQTKYEDRRANISLAYKVALQDYQGAESIVNSKIESLDKQYTRQVQAYTLLKDLVYDDLTASQKIKAEEQSRIRTDQAKVLTETYASAINNAVQNNAPAWVLSAIDEAARNPNATAATISSAAGKYGIDPNQTLDREIKQATLAEKYQNIAESKAKASAALTALPGPIQTKVQGIAGQFDAEQVVKNFNQIAQAKAFVDGVPNDTTNPADDQGLIYSFAKIMDPDSVVREGEYNTVQKYSQSWVKAYGSSVKQAINGTGFLSKEARENIKKTINSKFEVSERVYKNVYDEYGRRINKVTGGSDGTDYITDYAQAFETPTNTPQVDPKQATISGRTVTFPGGGTLTFPDDKSLNLFKKEQGL